VAAVELEDPTRYVIEEVAVVGDGDDGAGVVLEVAFEPCHRKIVEVVRGFVEEQDIGLPDEQSAEGDPAALAAREDVDLGVAGRAAEGVHGELEAGVELPRSHRFDLVLDHSLAIEHLLHLVVVHRFGESLGEGVELSEKRRGLGRALLDDLAHGLTWLQLGLLLEEADRVTGGTHDLAVRRLVDAGHDLQECALSRAVEAENADLGAIEEAERDVAQHRFLAMGPADLDHRKDDLLFVCSHAVLRDIRVAAGAPQVKVTAVVPRCVFPRPGMLATLRRR